MYTVVQLQYQSERTCGYVLMHNDTPLGRCLSGRRHHDHKLLISPCHVVTTSALRRGDRLRLEDVTGSDQTDAGRRYVLVPATPTQTAATNYWGVVKLADMD